MLPLKKIYIDSRHCTSDSRSNSDFKINLPMRITLPTNTSFYKTDSTIPVNWYTVEAGRIVLYTSELTVLLRVLLYAFCLKETIPLRHLSLLCAML